MKRFFEKRIQGLLKFLAGKTIEKYKPGVIGITGSVGKTSAKEAIAAVLRTIRTVRASYGNFNNEIGLPLTILGEYKKTGGGLFWLAVFIQALRNLLVKRPYPELLILEYAADKPGDIQYLLEIARPHLGVITGIGSIPAHSEFYTSIDEVIREKSRLIDAVPREGFAVINVDDSGTKPIIDRARAHVISFGAKEEAEVQITNFEHRIERGRPRGISFKISQGNNFVPIRIDGAAGIGHAYAAAAAAAVGSTFGMNLVRIADALHYYVPLPGRGRIIDARNGATIIDDAYNASPRSMQGALEALRSSKGSRRVAILGDMRELGKWSASAHEEIGKLAAKSADILIAVGPEAVGIVRSAAKTGMSKKKMFHFDAVEGLIPELLNLISKDDTILIKGSHGVALDRAVEELRKR